MLKKTPHALDLFKFSFVEVYCSVMDAVVLRRSAGEGGRGEVLQAAKLPLLPGHLPLSLAT